ncbi:MAG: DUF1698 domain-containing protein [bacterium]|nr:DUF1698 domain-containing protein [bacterium]
MDREEIIAEINRLGPWWRHSIDLGGGIRTKLKAGPRGDDLDRPREKWLGFKDVLPIDLSGKRVLDAGCSEGFFSIEAKRRGADYVLGIDADPRVIARADFARGVLDLDIDYRVSSVYDIDPGWGTFDIVFFLGVFYHLEHPFLGLNKVAGACKEMLFLDSQALMDDPSEGECEIMRFYKDGFGGDRTNRWLPNRKCLQAMLEKAGFEKINDLSYMNARALYQCLRQPGALFEKTAPGPRKNF